ncbi:MAG TPA: TolC family protein [Flavipsychrobacter sp.]|nr:TolC family protein [Flavipsychrobacter sp.]
MKKNKFLFFFILLHVWSQQSFALLDSALVLGRNDLINIIRQYHPVVLQANLQVKRAEAEVMQARGGFDPLLQSGYDRKTFDGKLYYNYFNPQLTIPTWYGLQIKAGLEEVFGERVTTEATLGKTSYLGAKLSSNELFFDGRRAALRQAQSLKSLSETERRMAVNDLMRDALAVYWDWLREYQNYTLLSNLINVNEERIRLVRIEFLQGNRPAIDTTEVVAQLLSLKQEQSATWLSFQNQGVLLSNYLWGENVQPFSLTPDIIPDTSILLGEHENYLNDILSLVDFDPSLHPKMEAYRNKLDFLEIERRLKAQYLMPKLSVKANMLNRGYEAPSEVSSTLLENNYKIGVDFALPLFMREARGAYRSSKLKIQETWLARDQEQLNLQNKVRAYYNEVVNLKEQINFYETAYANYFRLYQGEKTRFEIGESTLFILNSRENKLLEARQKLVELKTKWHKSYTGLLWAAGRFADMI